MPRVYVSKSTKPYKRYDPLVLKTAIETYETGNKSLAEVGKQFNIAKSVLHRHVTRKMNNQGGQRALSEEAEKYIIKYINICSEWGYPLDTYDLRIIIKGYLDRLGVEIKKFNNNLPGTDFVESFLKRHKKEISERICQNIKRSRAAVSPQIIEDYFRELQNSLEGVPLSNIVNYDESNLADDPGKKKVLTKRGVKYPERVMNHTKSSTSLMMAASADGTLLPCYVVYKASNLYNTWTTNGPPNCRYNRTSSGWFDSNTFEDWVETIAITYFSQKPGKKILIGDNLSSHLSLDIIKKCQELDIHFVFLPPNSTHVTQPLDVALFRPMKIAWRDILFTWKKSEGRVMPTIPKNVFPKLLKKLLEKMEPNTKQNILAGFMKAGISPLNKDKVLIRLPGHNTRPEFSMEEKEAIDESVLSVLKEMRYGPQHTRINKPKKINVVPGKSVQDSDYVDSDISSTNTFSDIDSQIATTSQKSKKRLNQTNSKKKDSTRTGKCKGVGKKSKPQKCNNKQNNNCEVLQEKQILKDSTVTGKENQISKTGLKDKGVDKKSKAQECNDTLNNNCEVLQEKQSFKDSTVTGKENRISKTGLKGKGVGKKSKAQECNNILNNNCEILQEKQILEEQNEIDIDRIDIHDLPVFLLEDNFTVVKDNSETEDYNAELEENYAVPENNFLVTVDPCTVKEDKKQPKIRILSDVLYKGNMKTPIVLKSSGNLLEKNSQDTEPLKPKPSTSRFERSNFYKNEIEIFRDLMDFDDD